jgi:hypothetical protein
MTSGGVVVRGGAAYRVDTDELAAVAGVLALVDSSVLEAATGLHDAVASAGGWAVDGQLPSSFARLCETLGWVLGQAQEAGAALRDQVGAAARSYAQADTGAVVRPRDSKGAAAR